VSIPCWLTNRDTMFVRTCAESLAKLDNVGQITILDCESTYPELLEWYESQSEFRVLKLKNHGAHAPWRSNEDLAGAGDFYFASDGDLDFTDCHPGLLTECQKVLEAYPEIIKAGPSLKIDDLPDTPMNVKVRAHEAKFWRKEWNPLWYDALIDTTAALYRKGHGWRGYGPALRCKPPYEVRHLPWYLDRLNLPPDMKHYVGRMKVDGLSWGPQFRIQS